MYRRWLSIGLGLVLLSWPDAALADVTVTNRAFSPIEVQVEDGDRRALQGGQAVTFKTMGAEPVVSVYHFGARKIRMKIRDGQRVRVTKNSNMFSLVPE
jgi:hypothetical protein